MIALPLLVSLIAQWPTDPSMPLFLEEDTRRSSSLSMFEAEDQSFVAAWISSPISERPDTITVQRVGADGVPVLSGTGTSTSIVTPAGGPSMVVAVEDLSTPGGIYLAWNETPPGEMPGASGAFAMRATIAASSSWGTRTMLSPLTTSFGFPRASPDGMGGAWIVFHRRLPDQLRFYHADANGFATGQDVQIDALNTTRLALTPFGNGNIFSAGRRRDRLNYDEVVGFAVSPTSTSAWARATVLQPSPNATTQSDSVQLEDGSIVVVWSNWPAATPLVLAQKLDVNGTPQWAENVVLATMTANPYNPAPFVKRDGAGGVVVLWRGNQGAPRSQARVQRLDATGAALWTPEGVVVDDIDSAGWARFAFDSETSVQVFYRPFGGNRLSVKRLALTDGSELWAQAVELTPTSNVSQSVAANERDTTFAFGDKDGAILGALFGSRPGLFRVRSDGTLGASESPVEEDAGVDAGVDAAIEADAETPNADAETPNADAMVVNADASVAGPDASVSDAGAEEPEESGCDCSASGSSSSEASAYVALALLVFMARGRSRRLRARSPAPLHRAGPR